MLRVLAAVTALGLLATAADARPIISKPTPPVFRLIRPDLQVSSLTITGNSPIGAVDVDIVDACNTGASFSPYIQVEFYTGKGGPTDGPVIGNSLVLRAGGGHLHLDVSSYHIPLDSYVVATVDPNNQIAEVVETNNQRTLNPASGPSPTPPSVCAGLHVKPVP